MVNSCCGEVRSQSQSRMSHERKAAVTKPAILHAARETIILLRPLVPSIHKYIGITWIDRGAALPLRVDLSIFFWNLYFSSINWLISRYYRALDIIQFLSWWICKIDKMLFPNLYYRKKNRKSYFKKILYYFIFVYVYDIRINKY